MLFLFNVQLRNKYDDDDDIDCCSNMSGWREDDLRQDAVSVHSFDVVRRRRLRAAEHDRLQHGLHGREVPREHARLLHGRRNDRHLRAHHRLGSTHGQEGRGARTYVTRRHTTFPV